MTTQEGSHTASHNHGKGAQRPTEPNSSTPTPTEGELEALIAEAEKAETHFRMQQRTGLADLIKGLREALSRTPGSMEVEAYDRLTRFAGSAEFGGESGNVVYPGGIFQTGGLNTFYADLRALLALSQPRPASTLPGDGEPGVPRVEAVIAKMREAVAKIQDAKKRGGVSRDPLIDPINAMPGWARELEMAVIDIEGDYEAYEDKLASPPPGVTLKADDEAHIKAMAEALFDHEPRNSAKRFTDQHGDVQYRWIDKAAWVLKHTLAALAPTPQPKGGE